jgi:glycosyltransferase involved in cell wall biosynthesis
VRILQVTPYFAPAWAYGGPPRVMYDYAAGLVELGHDVTVVTTDVLDAKRRAAPAEEILDGIHVRRLPNVSNSLAWHTKKYLPRGLVTTLAREMGRYDVVHVTDTRTYLTAMAYLAARARGIPFCLSPHGSLPGSSGFRGAVKSIYDRTLVRPMLGCARLLFAQTDHEARLLAESGGRPEAIRALPLPLDLADAEAGIEVGALRRLADVPAQTQIVLFLGRIHWLKGLDILIASIESLLGAGTVLVVVGRDDGHWGELAERHHEALATGAIRFVGPLYGNERFGAYADADVFCLTPRHWEETSVAALEAAACGAAVVVTEQSDIPGLVASGGGFVVPLEPEAIRDAVATALGRGAEMGALARAHISTQHDKNLVVRRLEGYLAEAVGVSRRAA